MYDILLKLNIDLLNIELEIVLDLKTCITMPIDSIKATLLEARFSSFVFYINVTFQSILAFSYKHS